MQLESVYVPWPSATEENDIHVALTMAAGSITQSGVPFPDL